MRITLFSIALSAICFFSHAQNIRYPVAAAYTQLQTYSSVAANPFSFTSNQAKLASGKMISAGFFAEKRFLLSDLSFYSAAFILPSNSGGFGLNADYFGSTEYNESQIGLAYGRVINNKIDIGVQINYYNVKANTYGNASAINFELGSILHITNQFEIGVHVYNPTESRLGKSEEERLPFIYSFGFGYDPSKNVFLGCEVEKSENEPVNFKAGVQYQFDPKLSARCGITTATSSYYFGIGILLNEIKIDATATVHPYLGITPGLLLIINIPSFH